MPNTATLLAMQQKAGVTPSVVVPKSAVTSIAKSTGVDLTTKTALPGSGLPNAAPTAQSAAGSGLPVTPGVKGYVPTAPSVSSTDPAYKLQGSGNPVYSTPAELAAGLAAGKFSQAQHDSALNALQKGGQGVDPLGFGGAPMTGTDENGNPIIGVNGVGIPQPKITTAPTSTSTPLVKPPTLKQARTDELNNIKGYINVPIYDDKGNLTGYDQKEDPTKTAELRAEKQASWDASDKLVQTDQQTRLKTQQQAGGITTTDTTPAPTPVKGPDFTVTDQSLATINSMIAADPTLAATYTPQMMDLLAKRTQLENDHNAAVTTFNNEDLNGNGVTDGVEQQVASSQTALEKRTAEADRINEENKQINLDAANLAKDMADIAQKKFDLDQHTNEQKQIQSNIESERKNRLLANKLGISTDGNGLRWMADEVQKGVDALSSLQQAGSLQDATFALQIGSQYAINVKTATNTYDSNKLQIDTNFANDIADLNKIVTLDAKDRADEKKTMTKDYLDALDANDTKFADQVKQFRTEMQAQKNFDLQMKKSDEATARADAAATRADNRADLATTKEDQRALESERNQKQTKINNIRGDLVSVQGYKEFFSSSSAYDTAFFTYKDYQAGKIPLTTMQETVGLLYEKVLDPNSVVREGEFDRAAQGLGASGVLEKVKQAVTSGRGFSKELVDGFMNVMTNAYDSRKDETMKGLAPIMNDISDWNTNVQHPQFVIDPSILIPKDLLPVSDGAKSAADDVTSDGPVSMAGLDHALAMAHQEHEGFGSPNAPTITKQNNPGALRWSSAQTAFGGEKGENGFTKFPTYASGLAALQADIHAKLNGKSSHIDYTKNPTFKDYVAVYAPSSDGNDPTSYAEALVKKLNEQGYNISLNTPLSELSKLS